MHGSDLVHIGATVRVCIGSCCPVDPAKERKANHPHPPSPTRRATLLHCLPTESQTVTGFFSSPTNPTTTSARRRRDGGAWPRPLLPSPPSSSAAPSPPASQSQSAAPAAKEDDAAGGTRGCSHSCCWWRNASHDHVHRQGGRGCCALEGRHPWPSPPVPLRWPPHRLVKAFFVGGAAVGDVSLLSKILAALTTGVIAIVVANPTDLVKVRLQADGKANAVKRSYSGALNAYATIIRQEGIGALWTGLGPNVARNAIINAAELVSYDQFKQMFLKLPGFTDNVFTHLLAGLGAGFFAVCIGSPVDVVKSRMMGDSTYRSTLDCFAKTLKIDLMVIFHRDLVLSTRDSLQTFVGLGHGM
ncbi:mitochondrial uncoupling protein 1-like isoform X2 [Miscanthus floridulus]|uniref:mitochondrial uncoupling protein 1-like isoform X2 n=1 Tax=Miscanthus floridulus TaxID=154761 RepID=UPI003459D195